MPARLYNISPLQPLAAAGYTLLTPNFRLARRIKSEWDRSQAAAGERAWEPLAVQPLESWLMQRWEQAVSLGLLSPQLVIGQLQALQLWQQVIAREERDTNAYHLLRPSAAAELASQARENLLRWQVDAADQAIRQLFGFDTDCATFQRWRDAFDQRLQSAGQATPADCVRQLLACAQRMPRAKTVLLEFDDIPPLSRATVEALCTDVQEFHPDQEPGQRIVHACADKRAELQAVASWAASTSRAEATTTIGIVLSDTAGDRNALEHLLRREFDCLGENYNSLPVNFSTGIALDRVPVVRDALGALAMALPRTQVADVVGLLRSRFLDLPDADTALANLFVKRLFDGGRAGLATAELRYLASTIQLDKSKGLALGRHLLNVAGMRELNRPALPSQWAEHFSCVLDTWGWPGPGALDSLEYQQVELWYQTLDELRAYDAVCESMVLADALQLLRSSCARQISQPQTADCNIQVLGPLEAAGLVFDQLWVVGMQAGSWPAPPRPNPFIPLSLQRQLQMPHATPEREWHFCATLMAQYAGAAPVLRASYCSQLDDIPELPSALLEGFTKEPLPAPPPVDPVWAERWQQRDMEVLSDQQAPAATAGELQRISGGSGLLEDQSQCPFRAFARRRLGVEPLGAFSLALSAADRGSLLHDALYGLWGSLGDHQGLMALDDSTEQGIVNEAVTGALQALPEHRRRALGVAYWELEAQRLGTLLHEWLAVERTRAEFVVSQREQDVTLALGQLEIRLRVDRIDQLPDGSRVIIDYKSGTSQVQDWLGDRPPRPQLLLYGVAAPGEASALTFAQVRPRASKFVGLGRADVAPGIRTDIARVVQGRMEADDWESLNERWRENLERLADEFVSGAAAVDPLAPASCTWCGLQALCRIGSAEEEVE